MKKTHSLWPGGGRLARKYLRRARKKGGAGAPGVIAVSGPGGYSDSLCDEPCYTEYVEQNLKTSGEIKYSKNIDISRIRIYSLLVINNGPQPAVIQAEMSPDGLTWGAFGELAYIVEAGGKRIFIPQCFLRYVRIKYRSWRLGHDTYITVWFQGQG
ncbi:MAG: DUF6385 domain-containing protein [Bacillota bacterium]